jgi:hypothetical protein
VVGLVSALRRHLERPVESEIAERGGELVKVEFTKQYHHHMNDKPYSALDREIITLAAVWDLIGSMVHYGHFMNNHKTENAELKFDSREASKLFLIILADFLSLPRKGVLGLNKPIAEGAMGTTYLGLLQRVVDEPKFAGDNSLLASSTRDFAKWLDGFVTVENVWLPSIERNGALRVKRMMYLKICGTASKHGFTRLDDIVKKICTLLAENGTNIDDGQGYLVIPEFQEWFQDNIFISSSTLIAWHLNEIRWGIYQYLSNEFQRSCTPTVPIGAGQYLYEYDVPTEVTRPLVRSMYWDLMNHVRSPPYFPRFTVSHFFRNLY